MAHLLEDIIQGILSSDGRRVKAAEDQLEEAYKDPECLHKLCQIMTTNSAMEVRQLATILLDKYIQKQTNWQMVSLEQRGVIKRGILQALVEEKERPVKNVIGALLGTIIGRDANAPDNWLDDVIKYVNEQCCSPDDLERELGSVTFATLTNSAPGQFLHQMQSTCDLYVNVLTNAKNQNKLTSKTVCNMCNGMTNLVPFTIGNRRVEDSISGTVPLLMKISNLFAQDDGKFDEFLMVFEVLESIGEYVPRIFKNIKGLVDFCLEILANLQTDKYIRIRMVTFIGHLVQVKKTKILQLNLLVNIMNAIFETMCHTSDINDARDTELFTDDVVDTAMQILDGICNSLSHNKWLPALLQFIELALQNPDPLRRRTAYLCMGVISEGCADIISEKYLEMMLNVIKAGLVDREPIVRISAYYALARFMQFCQPEISKYSSEIFNIFYDFISKVLMDIHLGNPEARNICRMFQAVQVQCRNLDLEILPHLPMLMECLFETLKPNNSLKFRESSLITIGYISRAAKVHMVGYLPRILDVLKAYLVENCDLRMEKLRCQAIQTWASIVRSVGKTNIAPYTNDSINFCLILLAADPIDPDLRTAIYNLLGGLSTVLHENMSSIFPKVMERMVLTVVSHQDIPPTPTSADNNNDTNDSDDDDDDFYDEIESDYAMEKEMAINVLKEFSANSGKAFAPYLPLVFNNVYKVISHPREGTRMSAIECITEFVLAFHRLDDKMAVKRYSSIVIPKFAEILRKDESAAVVSQAIEDTAILFKELQEDAAPTTVLKELIFNSIVDIFAMKCRCQWNGVFCVSGGAPSNETGGDDDDDNELGENIFEITVDLFNSFGYVVEPVQYSIYFGKVLYTLEKTLNAIKQNITESRRNLVLTSLSDSLRHLGSFVDNYFEVLCPIFVNGTTDEDSLVRQHCYYALGELMLQGEKKSLEFCPIILNTLSEAITRETDPACMDYICGAVARLLAEKHLPFDITNVLPALLSHLPLRLEFHENDIILQTFHILFEKSRASIMQYLEQMLAITCEILAKGQTQDEDVTENAMDFIKMIRQQYPNQIQSLYSVNPEMYNFVMSL